MEIRPVCVADEFQNMPNQSEIVTDEHVGHAVGLGRVDDGQPPSSVGPEPWTGFCNLCTAGTLASSSLSPVGRPSLAVGL